MNNFQTGEVPMNMYMLDRLLTQRDMLIKGVIDRAGDDVRAIVVEIEKIDEYLMKYFSYCGLTTEEIKCSQS